MFRGMLIGIFRIQRQSGFTKHATIGRSEHFCLFAALRTIDDLSAGGQDTSPEIDRHAAEHYEHAENHKNRDEKSPFFT